MSAGTTPRAVRIDDDLWEAALEKSERIGITISSVVRDALMQWLDESLEGDRPNEQL